MGTCSSNMDNRLVLLPAAVLLWACYAPADAYRCSNPDVCLQWYNDIYYQTEYGMDLEKIENLIEKHCKKIGDTKPFSKMCYYMQGVKRKVSKDMKQGAPAELACKRYIDADQAICELRFPKKLDPSMDLEKMRVKELRHLMQEYEVECTNCLEKSDMIKRIRETIMKPEKELWAGPGKAGVVHTTTIRCWYCTTALP